MKTAWLLAFASIAVGASAAEPDQRRLKGFVGGWNGPGWWEFQITTHGVVDVVTTEHITKSLREEEQLELGRLLAALPVANREYGCDAPLPVDTAAYYFLEISRPLESSRPDAFSGSTTVRTACEAIRHQRCVPWLPSGASCAGSLRMRMLSGQRRACSGRRGFEDLRGSCRTKVSGPLRQGE